jgi:hypothetical protein
LTGQPRRQFDGHPARADAHLALPVHHAPRHGRTSPRPAGALLLLGLTMLFFGPTKLIPVAFALATLYLALAHPPVLASD